jgi:superfamily II DNA or RNA helicase
MRLSGFPDLKREELAELSSWTELRNAHRLLKEGAVLSADWSEPELKSKVRDGGVEFQPTLNLKSLTFVRCQCSCPAGRRGQACAHALAAYLYLHRLDEESSLPQPVAPAVTSAQSASANDNPAKGRDSRLESVLEEAGAPLLGLRLHFPPNAEAALKRNAMVGKLAFLYEGELIAPEKFGRTRKVSLEAEARQCLADLESLCGGTLSSLLQLKRNQLLQLLSGGPAGMGLWGGPHGEREWTRAEFDALVKDLQRQEAASEVRGPEVRRSRAVRTPSASLMRPVNSPVAEVLPSNWMIVDGSSKYLSVMLRDKDHPQYRRCADWLRAEGFRKEPSNGRWWLRDSHKVLSFLAEKKAHMEANYDVAFTDGFRARTRHIINLEVAVSTRKLKNDYEVELSLGGEGVDTAEIQKALLAGRNYIVKEERIYLVDTQTLDRLASAGKALGDDPNRVETGLFRARIGAASLADAGRILEDLDDEAVLPSDWKERSGAIREVGRLQPAPLSDSFQERLRAYQLVGVAWLWHLWRHRLGGILADEMGLGKTIQAIGLLACWHQEKQGKEAAHALIIVPASLLGNWMRELRDWAPQLPVTLHHGTGRMREIEELNGPSILLTSYGTLRNDESLLNSLEYDLILADEAQHVKNRRTRAARVLRSLRGGGRFILTGTPIENSVEDLRSLFDFCLPGYLKRSPRETRGEERLWYEKRQVEKAAPYILRRAKQMVAPELPEKIEQTLWCELTPAQKLLYTKVREKSEQELMQLAMAGVSENRLRFQILTELLRLRQVCADPFLVDSTLPMEASGKFLAFRELLQEALDGGHRILVFSQFLGILQRLREWLRAEDLLSVSIEGRTRDRLAVCEQFNGDPSIPVCLISLKAGGTGLNLTGADTVVHFDPWWNPAVEDQATDRTHRIGQSRTVTSYKLVTEGTVEEKVVALQAKKASLLRDLLDESSQQSAKVDLDTLKSLIEFDKS